MNYEGTYSRWYTYEAFRNNWVIYRWRLLWSYTTRMEGRGEIPFGHEPYFYIDRFNFSTCTSFVGADEKESLSTAVVWRACGYPFIEERHTWLCGRSGIRSEPLLDNFDYWRNTHHNLFNNNIKLMDVLEHMQ